MLTNCFLFMITYRQIDTLYCICMYICMYEYLKKNLCNFFYSPIPSLTCLLTYSFITFRTSKKYMYGVRTLHLLCSDFFFFNAGWSPADSVRNSIRFIIFVNQSYPDHQVHFEHVLTLRSSLLRHLQIPKSLHGQFKN